MARIRSIKPEFFVDEDLQDLEAENPGKFCMLVFAGLWGHCSRFGVFEWRPRTLKLSILPFLNYDLAETLCLLEKAGFIARFFVDGREYGHVRSFEMHQRISGKEALSSPVLPLPPGNGIGEAPGNTVGESSEGEKGNTGEAPGKHPESQERKGKEREKERDITGGGGDTAREAVVEEEQGGAIEQEVQRIVAMHRSVCGLSSLPPVAIVRAILQGGQVVSLIDDVYQVHGGDVPKYRQRNIVERLTALRDGTGERASPAGQRRVAGVSTRMSASERRMRSTVQSAREFAGGKDD